MALIIFFVVVVDGNQNSWGKFTFSWWGQLTMIKRSNMIGPISKYTHLKIKLMNMVTNKFIRSEHIFQSQFESKLLIQSTIHV